MTFIPKDHIKNYVKFMWKEYIKGIKGVVVLLLTVGYLIFDFVFWEIANPIMRYLLKKDLSNRFVNYTISLNRYLILVVFLSFFIVSELMGLYSIKLFAQGSLMLGLIIYVIKILPVIVAFTILDKAKDKLYTFKWFEYLHIRITNYVNKIKEYFQPLKNALIEKLTELKLKISSERNLITKWFSRVFIKIKSKY